MSGAIHCDLSRTPPFARWCEVSSLHNFNLHVRSETREPPPDMLLGFWHVSEGSNLEGSIEGRNREKSAW
jgi:hypothetical protein